MKTIKIIAIALLAGFAGESLISNEMQARIAEMLKNFLQIACEKLEK